MTEQHNGHADGARDEPVYPYMWAMLNTVFLLLALGAVADPNPQDLWPKVTGTAALIGAGLMQSQGLAPDRSRTSRIFTAAFLAADVLLVVLLWSVR